MLKRSLVAVPAAVAIVALATGVALALAGASSIKIASNKPVSACDQAITVTGTLVDTATPSAAASQTLTVLRSTNGVNYSRAATGTTNAQGAYAWTTSVRTRTYFRFTFAGSAESSETTSPILLQQCTALFSKVSTIATVRAGTKFAVDGYLSPRHVASKPCVQLLCDYWNGSRWVYSRWALATNQDASADRTRYRATLSLPWAGRWRVRAFHSDWSHLNTYSAPQYITVTPQYVVVIDAGHQGQGDYRPDPIGPGSSITKPAVADGAEGIVTHRRESLDNLEVSLKLRDLLAAKGIKVVMIRTSENVDIANSQRAKTANAAHANLFIHLHCDGVDDQSVHGLLMLVPASDQWTGPIVSSSARAGRDIQTATLGTTGARDRGTTPRSDMAGFNWSQVPTVMVEMGVMSNPAEDRNLAAYSYEQRLANGMAIGIGNFLAGK